MKPIKEWSFKIWALAYFIFMIVLAGISYLFNKAGVNIYANYIFSVIVLAHLTIVCRKDVYNGKPLLQNLLTITLLCSILILTLDEFYSRITAVDIGYRILIILLVVVFMFYWFRDRAKAKKDYNEMLAKATKGTEIIDVPKGGKNGKNN